MGKFRPPKVLSINSHFVICPNVQVISAQLIGASEPGTRQDSIVSAKTPTWLHNEMELCDQQQPRTPNFGLLNLVVYNGLILQYLQKIYWWYEGVVSRYQQEIDFC